MKKVAVIMGATGTGKTDLAKKIFDNMACKLISIDSAMVYVDMDIGTAKPAKSELSSYPHALIDIRLPTDNFTIADCVNLVPNLINQALKDDLLPVLVGGTMMYHYVLQNGMHVLPSSTKAVRLAVTAEYNKYGLQHQWQKLLLLDKDYAVKLMPTDKQRIHRALELLELGLQPSALLAREKSPGVLQKYNLVNICLSYESRACLYKKLEQRFDNMLSLGLLDEIEMLMKKYPNIINSSAFSSIGYRQMSQYIIGNSPKGVAMEQTKTATRRLAKRQITWLKRWQGNSVAVNPEDFALESKIRNLLENK